MRKRIKKALTLLMSTAIMLTSVPFTGGVKVQADPAITYKTVLGDAYPYGVITKAFHKKNHAQTNMAVIDYYPDDVNNIDPDIIMSHDIPFIIGEVKPSAISQVNFGASTYYNDGDNTTKSVSFSITTSSDETAFKKDDSGDYDLVFTKKTKAEIEATVNAMMAHMTAQSDMLKAQPPTIEITDAMLEAANPGQLAENINQFTIDTTTAAYADDAVIYISFPAGSQAAKILAKGEGYTIKKKENQVYVMNVLGTENSADEPSDGPLLINAMKAQIVTSAGTVAMDTRGTNDNTAEKNRQLEKYITKKIIWNFPNATDIKLKETAGLFLAPKAAVTCKSTSSGWIFAGESFTNEASQWHFLLDLDTEKNTPSPAPSTEPSSIPSTEPSSSVAPSGTPSTKPSSSVAPSGTPSTKPSSSVAPSGTPSTKPSSSVAPSGTPSTKPSSSVAPSGTPSTKPSSSVAPSGTPSTKPSSSVAPSGTPSTEPSSSVAPSGTPSTKPSSSVAPSGTPSTEPSAPVTPQKVKISKVATGVSGELPNAQMKLYDTTGGTEVEVDSWTSGIEPHEAQSDKIIIGHTYKIKEVTPPENYNVATDITFTIGADGKIKDVDFASSYDVNAGLIVMLDTAKKLDPTPKPQTLKISKQDVSGKELSKAKMTLYEGTSVLTGTKVDEWESGDAAHEINAPTIKLNTSYVIHEVTPPTNYEVATDITFTIGADGKIKDVKEAAASNAALGLIVMVDKAKENASPSPSTSPKPSSTPSAKPSSSPTPSSSPSVEPSSKPSAKPSSKPSSKPSAKPSAKPSKNPTNTEDSNDKKDQTNGSITGTGTSNLVADSTDSKLKTDTKTNTDTTKKKSKSNQVATGDDFNLFGILRIMIISGLVLILAIFAKRRLLKEEK